MNEKLIKIVKKFIGVLPSDWESMIFSVFKRDCEVNGVKTVSKEFKCYSLAKSLEQPIDIIKVYEENFEVEDLFFEFMDYLYLTYLKNSEDNFVSFKLISDGNYELKTDKLDNDITNDKMLSIIKNYLKK